MGESWQLDEKDHAVQLACIRLAKLEHYKETFTDHQYLGLKNMLTEDKTIAEIYRCHVKAFYLYQLIEHQNKGDTAALRAELLHTAEQLLQLSRQLNAKEIDVSYHQRPGRDHPVHQFNKSVMQLDITGLYMLYTKLAKPDEVRQTYTFRPAVNLTLVENARAKSSRWHSTDTAALDDLWGISSTQDGDACLLSMPTENCPKIKLTCPIPNATYAVYLKFHHSLRVSFDNECWHNLEYRRNKGALRIAEIDDGTFEMFFDDRATTAGASLEEIVLEKID